MNTYKVTHAGYRDRTSKSLNDALTVEQVIADVDDALTALAQARHTISQMYRNIDWTQFTEVRVDKA
jgi:hypothetical protein